MMDTLLKLSLNNEKDDKKNKEYSLLIVSGYMHM